MVKKRTAVNKMFTTEMMLMEKLFIGLFGITTGIFIGFILPTLGKLAPPITYILLFVPIGYVCYSEIYLPEQ